MAVANCPGGSLVRAMATWIRTGKPGISGTKIRSKIFQKKKSNDMNWLSWTFAQFWLRRFFWSQRCKVSIMFQFQWFQAFVFQILQLYENSMKVVWNSRSCNSPKNVTNTSSWHIMVASDLRLWVTVLEKCWHEGHYQGQDWCILGC